MPSAALVSDAGTGMAALNETHTSPQYRNHARQDELGHFLVDHYKIRTPKDLTSCEVCHR